MCVGLATAPFINGVFSCIVLYLCWDRLGLVKTKANVLERSYQFKRGSMKLETCEYRIVFFCCRTLVLRTK